jgi:hypothetical protein
MRTSLGRDLGEGKSVQLLFAFLVIILTSASCVIAQGTSQSSASPSSESQYSQANQLAERVRAGDSNAALPLAREVFKNAGIPVEVADAFGFTERIAQAEVDYRKGVHAPIHEEDVARAVNNFARSIGTPDWTHTTPAEVRRLRVHLYIAVPRLFANTEGRDSNGRYPLFSSKLSPTEAAYLATTMLYMKVFSADFQITEAEQKNLTDSKSRAAIHAQRESFALDLVEGRSSSTSPRDLLNLAGGLFDDLGIRDKAGAVSQLQNIAHKFAIQKGGM